MEATFSVNKYDALIKLGKLNNKNKILDREKMVRLNSIINSNLNQEVEIGEYRDYILVSSDNKKFIQKMGLLSAPQKKLIHRISNLKKIVLFFWR